LSSSLNKSAASLKNPIHYFKLHCPLHKTIQIQIHALTLLSIHKRRMFRTWLMVASALS
jgi:hypothetical protein